MAPPGLADRVQAEAERIDHMPQPQDQIGATANSLRALMATLDTDEERVQLSLMMYRMTMAMTPAATHRAVYEVYKRMGILSEEQLRSGLPDAEGAPDAEGEEGC